MLEQEKDMLMQGAEVVEQAYQWYQKQMLNLQEKQKYIAQSNSYQVHQLFNFKSFQLGTYLLGLASHLTIEVIS